jgi:hypothetical protein
MALRTHIIRGMHNRPALAAIQRQFHSVNMNINREDHIKHITRLGRVVALF